MEAGESLLSVCGVHFTLTKMWDIYTWDRLKITNNEWWNSYREDANMLFEYTPRDKKERWGSVGKIYLWLSSVRPRRKQPKEWDSGGGQLTNKYNVFEKNFSWKARRDCSKVVNLRKEALFSVFLIFYNM